MDKIQKLGTNLKKKFQREGQELQKTMTPAESLHYMEDENIYTGHGQ